MGCLYGMGRLAYGRLGGIMALMHMFSDLMIPQKLTRD